MGLQHRVLLGAHEELLGQHRTRLAVFFLKCQSPISDGIMSFLDGVWQSESAKEVAMGRGGFQERTCLNSHPCTKTTGCLQNCYLSPMAVQPPTLCPSSLHTMIFHVSIKQQTPIIPTSLVEK